MFKHLSYLYTGFDKTLVFTYKSKVSLKDEWKKNTELVNTDLHNTV